MTILVEHDNSISGRHGISEDEISTLEDLLPLIQNYIQAGSCVYKLTILPDLEGGAWLEPAQLRLRRPSSKTSWKIFLIQKIILDFLLKCGIIKIQKKGENN